MLEEIVKDLRKAINDKGSYIDKYAFVINDDYIGKICSNKEDAEHELVMGQYLYRNGINVPKMIDTIRPDKFLESYAKDGIKKWTLIMERIQGYHLDNLKVEEIVFAYQKLEGEINKVLDLGILPNDSAYVGNSIYVPEERKVYLIDFELWERGSSRKVEEFRESLKEDLKLNL